DLGGRFDHAAARGHRVGADETQRGSTFPDTVVNKKARSLLDPELARRDPTIVERLRDSLERVFTAPPRANVRACGQCTLRAPSFAFRNDPRGLAVSGQHQYEK